MGYLICDKCAGYYELQEGEFPEDFERCNCGGYLEYVEEIELSKDRDKFMLSHQNLRRISGISVGAVIILITFFIYSPDPFSASFAYNNISFIIWGAAGLTAALIAGGNIRSGASNGFYAACLSGLVVILFFYGMPNNIFNSPSLADNLAFLGALCVVYMFVPSIFSMMGGLLVNLAKSIVQKLV